MTEKLCPCCSTSFTLDEEDWRNSLFLHVQAFLFAVPDASTGADLYELSRSYSSCTVAHNRALFVLRQIALLTDDPESEQGVDPRARALQFLKVHNLLPEQKELL